MTAPAVSVVIPTFRREEDVVRAVRSALGQPGVDLEVIVLDDSADNSAAAPVAQLGDPRVRFVPCAEPTGGVPARVRNRGLAMARGEFVHFLDDDDELENGALDALASALRAAPSVGVAVGLVRPFGTDDEVLAQQAAYFSDASVRLRRLRKSRDLCAALLFTSTPLVNSSCMVRRRVALDIGGYAENVARCEDVEFYLRASRRAGHVHVDRPVVRYQTGRPSLMHSLADNELIGQSYRVMHHRYRRQHGNIEFLSLRLRAKWWGAAGAPGVTRHFAGSSSTA